MSRQTRQARRRLALVGTLLTLVPAVTLAGGTECVIHEWAVPPGEWAGSGDFDPTPLLMTATTRWAFHLDGCSLSTGTCDVFGSGSRTFQNGGERTEWYPTNTQPIVSNPAGNTVIYEFSMRDAFVPIEGQPRFEDLDWTLTAELPSPPSDSPSAAELATATSLDIEITHWVDNTFFVISWSGGATDTVFTSCTLVPAVLTIDDVSEDEGATGGTNASLFTVTRSHNAQAVSVTAETADGSATAGIDYTALPPTLIEFAAGGPLARTVTVDLTGDDTVELDESFSVELSLPTNATIGDGSGAGTIANDDAATVSIDQVAQVEGSGGGTVPLVFNVTLDGPVDVAVTVDVDSADGTAEDEGGAGDYSAVHDVVSFNSRWGPAEGSQVETVSFDVAADDLPERDENFFLELSNLNAGGRAVTLATAEGEATLINDDEACPGFALYLQPFDSPAAIGGHPATSGADAAYEDIVDGTGEVSTLPPGPVSSLRVWGFGDASGVACPLDPLARFDLFFAADAGGVPGALVAARTGLTGRLAPAGPDVTRVDLDFETFDGATVSWISVQREEVGGCAFRWLAEPFVETYDNRVFIPPGSAADDAYLCVGHSRIFGDGFESGDTSAWSTVVP
jgi:hypothetical protein